MNKRRFVTAMLTAAAMPAAAQDKHTSPTVRQAAASTGSPALLTITGRVGRTNRPPFDPTSDLLMSKHHVTFERAFALTHEMLRALPAVTIEATLEYDKQLHRLTGPRLTDVLAAASVDWGNVDPANATIALRAIDGYAPGLSLRDARRYEYIVATARDGVPLALGGLGPLWAIYPADRFPEMAARPLSDRFAACPWGLYHIDVQA